MEMPECYDSVNTEYYIIGATIESLLIYASTCPRVLHGLKAHKNSAFKQIVRRCEVVHDTAPEPVL